MADRRQLYKYKGDRCAHCGLSVEAMVEQFGDFTRIFEFNHIDPSQKHKDYDNLIRREISTEQLNEVDKCVLLCRVCHGIAHQQNLNAKVCVRIRAGQRSWAQTFEGQLIRNLRTRAATFFTDDKPLFHPYRVQVGGKKPTILFGEELWKGKLFGLIRQLPKSKHLRIMGWDNAPLVEMHADGKNSYRAKQDISFPLIDCEMHRGHNDPVFLWIRNGIALTRDGEVIHSGILEYRANIVPPKR